MTCQEVMEYMQRQLDDDLNDHEADALTAHTRYCSDCADMFERLKRLSAELDSLPKVVPAFSLVDAIIPQLDRIDSERQGSEWTIETPLVGEAAQPNDEWEAEVVPLSRRSPRDRKKGWLKRISWPAVTGVAAAGLVAGLFLVLFNPVNPPELKNETANLESAAASSEEPQSSVADRAITKQSADEVRIESTKSTNAQAPSVSEKRYVSEQTTEAADSSGGGQIKVVKPYADLPSVSDKSTTGASVPLAPSDDATAAASDSAAGAEKLRNESELMFIVKDQYGEPMGITSGGNSSSSDISNVVLSPDGTLSAAIVDGAVLVYTTQEGTVQLDSGKKTGVISGLQWSDDSKALFFEVKDGEGPKTHYKIDTREWTITTQ